MDEAQKQQLHQAIENATVKILIGNTFKGSGFFISPDGYVLTAYHCIGVYPPEIWVETRFDGRYLAQLEPDKSLLSNQYDIAVLRVFNYPPSHYVPLGFVGSENINDAVVAIGYPAGYYRLYEGRIAGVDEPTLASDVIKGEGQSGGLVYHYRSQRVVGLASAIWKREVIVNEGLAVRFENLFKKWEELREINQHVATAWDQRLQRLRQGKPEAFKPPSKPEEVKEVVVKRKISWMRNLVGGLVIVLGSIIVIKALQQPMTGSRALSVATPKTVEVQPPPSVPSNTTTPEGKLEEARRQAEEQRDSKQPGTVFQDQLKDGGLGPKMVVIPAGRFQMGDLQGTGSSDEKPVHWVNVEKFAMGQYEVTRGEFGQFVQATDYKTEAETGGGCYGWTGEKWGVKAEFSWRNVGFTQEESHPVVCVSWNDATAYAQWLSQQTGRTYRLPTEAEWEYAARAGTTTNYWWGNEIGQNNANCYECGSQWDGKQTAPVGSFKANPFNLYDVVGNVWEWTCSDYVGYGSEKETICSKKSTDNKSLRGGSWGSISNDCRVASRNSNAPAVRGSSGFRVLLVLP